MNTQYGKVDNKTPKEDKKTLSLPCFRNLRVGEVAKKKKQRPDLGRAQEITHMLSATFCTLGAIAQICYCYCSPSPPTADCALPLVRQF